MRIAPALIVLATIATPAAAQDRRSGPPVGGEMVARLGDPAMQDVLARTVVGLADAVLATRVGPLARLTDRHDDIRPDDTLADLTRREDPGFRARLYDDTRQGVATAGAVAGDLASLAAELTATIARVRGVVGVPSRGYDEPIDDYEDDDGRD